MGKDYHVVSFSGSKDSTAMLIRMLELEMPIDEIVFCDTTVEFPQMYEHLRKVQDYIGKSITILKAEHDYEYMLLEHEVKKRNGNKQSGYSFADMRGRWCTKYFKQNLVNKYYRSKGSDKTIIEYVGIAYDEQNRIKDKKYPLVDWKWTEADALAYCYKKGFDWGGLYKNFDRVSCWCCPLQRISELRKLRTNYPDLWKKLLDWQNRTWRKFRKDYSVNELEIKFSKEDELEKIQTSLF